MCLSGCLWSTVLQEEHVTSESLCSNWQCVTVFVFVFEKIKKKQLLDESNDHFERCSCGSCRWFPAFTHCVFRWARVCVLLAVQYVDACVEEVRSAGQLPFLYLSSSVSFIIHVPQFVAWKNNPVIWCGKRVCETGHVCSAMMKFPQLCKVQFWITYNLEYFSWYFSLWIIPSSNQYLELNHLD